MTDQQWQLPPGVTRGTQEYFESDAIAEDYDAYFAYTSLFELDQSILIDEFGKSDSGQIVADFGCGTGRALVALGRVGYRGLAIDLSQKMLQIVQEKADKENLSIQCLKANLVELEGLKQASVDHGVCLFSTLGMIQGRRNRERAVGHFRRVIRPGGRLVIHVHNYWYNLYDPGGPKWMMQNWLKSFSDQSTEIGDRTYSYRGVYNMFLHVFTRREIKKLLRQSGFQVEKMIPLNPTRMNRLSHAWCFSSLRSNGWIIVCS